MNRHRLYWSQMGVEGSGQHREKRAKLQEELQKLIDIHGMEEVTTEIRILYQNNREKLEGSKLLKI